MYVCMVVYVCSSLYIGVAAAVMETCRTAAQYETAQAAVAAASVAYDAAMTAWEAVASDEIIYFGLLLRWR